LLLILTHNNTPCNTSKYTSIHTFFFPLLYLVLTYNLFGDIITVDDRTMSISSNLGAMAKAVQMVACGREHTIALTRGGQIWCWGDNEQGQLGIGMLSKSDYTSTSAVASSGSFVDSSQPSSSGSLSPTLTAQQRALQDRFFPHAARAKEASVRTNKRIRTCVLQPVKLPDVFGGATVTKIACGSWHSICLAHRGMSSSVYVWGRAVEGQLGNGTEGEFTGTQAKRRRTNADVPTLVPSLSGLHIRTVTCGDTNTACVLAHGLLYTWGDASLGKCGHGFHQERQLLPNLVRGALIDERITDVSLGFEHSGCVTESGRVFMWGNNYFGRLGLGDEDNRYEPCLVGGVLSDVFVTSLSCGGYHTMAVDRSGRLWVWGKADARLGLGSLGATSLGGLGQKESASIKIPRLHTMLESKGYVERISHRDRSLDPGGTHAAKSTAGDAEQLHRRTRVVKAVAAFEHSMIMTSTGQLLTFVINTCGKLGIEENLFRGVGRTGPG
jgi:alpha-tubulin suppressor-like RCC1 family protein